MAGQQQSQREGGPLDGWERPQPGGLGAPGPRWDGAHGVASGDSAGEVEDGRLLLPSGLELPLAGFWWRAGSYAIDFITIWVGLIVIAAMWGGDALTADARTPAAQAAAARVYAIGLTFQIAYYWLWNSIGWSPGKRVLGMRIVTDGGHPPGAARGLARTLVAIVSAMPLWLGYMWAARDKRRQTWHDKAARTFVVRMPPPEDDVDE